MGAPVLRRDVRAHSPREDVLKIRHGSESCQNVSFLLFINN